MMKKTGLDQRYVIFEFFDEFMNGDIYFVWDCVVFKFWV